MSTKHLFLTLLAAFSLAFACQKPEANLSYPSIEISLSEASVAEPASSFTVQVISNRAWRVTSDVPWIAVDPDSGSGSMTDTPVTVTVMENTSFTRSGHVVFDIVYDNATLTIAQAGNGSPEDYIIFFNDFDKETATQSYGTSGTSWPYLDQFDGWKHESGVGIANMTYDFSNVSARANSMSNGTYSDYAGSGANNLLFGANGHIAVKNLDLKNFKNFHLSFGTEKYDNNDKTALFDPAEMPVYVSADGAKWIPLSYSYLGTAAGRWNVAEAYFSVPDDVTTLSIYVMATMASAYRLDDLKLDVPEEGSGPVLDFSNGTDLPSGGGGGGGGSDYENAPAKTVQEFIAAADKNTYYKLTGTVSKFNSNYCSFDLTDDSGSIYVYSVDNKDAWSSKIKNGGTVTLAGKYLYYEKNSQHEVVNAYILSFTDGGGDTPSGGGTPKGTGTLDDPYNPAGAANAVKNLTWTSNTEYQKTEPVYVKGKIAKIANNGTFGQSGTYGNASFYISEDGTGDGEFYIFRTMYFNGEKYTSGTDIKVGDEVVIYGPLMNY
ncbi:MAG: BACON domain-containing protein, partial [Bacteroidales bacterium]|nr:BACON domain-containing protein [Bacteroidales bacterium]